MQYKCNCTMTFHSETLLKADTISIFTTHKKEAETAFKIMTKYTSQHEPATEVQNTNQKKKNIHTLLNFNLLPHIISPETELNVMA